MHPMDAIGKPFSFLQIEPLRISRRLLHLRREAMRKTTKFSPEVIERAVRMVEESQPQHESQWAAIVSIAAKIGCTAETLRRWVRQHETNAGQRPGLSTQEQQRIKDLERENRELRQANEILRKASAYFAQAELDRRFKP